MRGKFIDNIFDASCEEYHHNIALITETGSSAISYSELNSNASALEASLRSFLYCDGNAGNHENVQDSCRRTVAVMTERNVAMVVAIIAILKAGAAYVPVDPSFPPDRQSHIFTHSKSKLLVIDLSSYSNALSLGVQLPPVIVIDPSCGKVCKIIGVEFTNTMELIPVRNPQDLAYVLYTSGSTGKPKGVMVTHEGVVNIVNWFADELQIKSKSVVLGLTTFCFDISVLEMFMPLFRGGTLVIASSSTQKDPFHLLDVIRDRNVTVVQATPTTYEMMLATGWRGDSNIDFLVRMNSLIIILLNRVDYEHTV